VCLFILSLFYCSFFFWLGLDEVFIILQFLVEHFKFFLSLYLLFRLFLIWMKLIGPILILLKVSLSWFLVSILSIVLAEGGGGCFDYFVLFKIWNIRKRMVLKRNIYSLM